MSAGERTPGGGPPQRRDGPFALPAAGLRLAAALTARPLLLLRHGGGWAAGLGRAGSGRAAVGVTTAALAELITDATTGPDHPLPAADAARLRASLDGLTRLVRAGGTDGGATDEHAAGGRDTGGPRGAAAPGAPAAGTADGPVRGRDVAATPGAVVLRTPMFELLQYLPVTEQVHTTPVLVVPPLVHRYWIADLAPGYSLVEHLVGHGLQVFALSWRAAGPADAGRDLDAHAAAVLDALEACTRIARTPRASLLGVRTGGLLAAAVQAHQAAIGLDDRVAGACYLATALDRPAPPSTPAQADARAAAAGVADRDGVLDGRSAVAAWSPPHPRAPRPGDAAHPRAARALRAWAEDLLPLPAGLHADLIAWAEAGGTGARVLGTPVHPSELRRDGYLVTVADAPGSPWTDGHRTARLLGGSCRLVLVPGDTAGGLVAPPGSATTFRAGTGADGGGDPDAWLAATAETDGSWWDDLAGWLTARAGALRDAPPELGGRRLPPLHPAPGTYLTAGPAEPATG